ncbi:MAG: tetratricopeptide repeat protein [Chloroflexi bacterium]|nr:tetratricopeptide repeat protein [Chloroflexota bacterium]
MTDAQTLYREGVAAIREHKNITEGRRLLTQSLRLNPDNDMAWLWLARTVSDVEKQRQCVERALTINPTNAQALAFRHKLAPAVNGSVPSVQPVPVSSPRQALKLGDSKNLEPLLKTAQKLLDDGNTEGAIAEWVKVLQHQPDHETALGSAVRHLSRLRFYDDAKELVWRALDYGTTHPSVYLTAIDLLKREGRYGEADDMRRRLAGLPTVSETVISDVVDYFLRGGQVQDAQDILTQALAHRPDSQKLLVRLGDLYHELGQEREARETYDRAARLGLRTEDGRLADRKLTQFAPTLTDRERGSKLLALREAVGIGLFYLLLGWQDAGLNLLNLGSPRWLGVALSTLGAYLLVTATSSPQQQPLAGWFGGKVPEAASEGEATTLPVLPLEARLLFGIAGLALLALAFYLVLGAAISLITNPTPPPFYIPSMQEIFEWE